MRRGGCGGRKIALVWGLQGGNFCGLKPPDESRAGPACDISIHLPQHGLLETDCSRHSHLQAYRWAEDDC